MAWEGGCGLMMSLSSIYQHYVFVWKWDANVDEDGFNKLCQGHDHNECFNILIKIYTQ